MKKYDFEFAKELILGNAEHIESASLGIHEDWWWTAETVWENGEFTKDLDSIKYIGGIDGSSWATPALHLSFKDGTETMLEISIGETDGVCNIPNFLGVMSGPVQENIVPLIKKIYLEREKKLKRIFSGTEFSKEILGET